LNKICDIFLCECIDSQKSTYQKSNYSIPHANAYRHDGTKPRVVVYCSFLPDVPINRQYVQQQLQHWIEGRYPSGNQWINHQHHQGNNMKPIRNTTLANVRTNVTTTTVTMNDTDNGKDNDSDTHPQRYEQRYHDILQILSTPLARRLAGVDEWE
jgi:hypothetical protein